MLGLLALWFGVFAPFAVYSGARSWRRIRASGGELTGATSALGGLVAGLIGVAVIIAGTIWWVVASS